MEFNLRQSPGAKPVSVVVASAHLSAFPWLHERQREKELEMLTGELTARGLGKGGSLVVMGDCNFHREAENAAIPKGWSEIPAVVGLGNTWDYQRNTMLPKMLPSRNMYNTVWDSAMRLDRVLVHGNVLDWGFTEARLFANERIHKESECTQSWQAYLYPSDHYGLLVEIPLAVKENSKHSRAPSPKRGGDNIRVGWLWVLGGRVGPFGAACWLLLGALVVGKGCQLGWPVTATAMVAMFVTGCVRLVVRHR